MTLPFKAGDEVAVLVSGLGATPVMELYVLYDEIDRLRKEAELFSSDAIGECGIDNHWKYGSPETQMELFMAEATLASSLGLPLIIHSRDADREMRAALSSSDFKASAVMHCFSSDDEMARFVLDRGLYVSFAGNVTYKGNECIRRAAMMVPDDRILVETDAPYLAPLPFRGKPCLPEYTETTLTFLASLRHQDVEELKEKVRNNLASFMKRNESVRSIHRSRIPVVHDHTGPGIILADETHGC